MPSPKVFNHCVVQTNINGKIRYIDATSSLQGGNYDEINFPDYQILLVLDESENGLLKVPFQHNGNTYEIDYFTIKDSIQPAKLQIVTTFKGFDADNLRYELAQNSKENIEKKYRDFYAALYPHLSRAT